MDAPPPPCDDLDGEAFCPLDWWVRLLMSLGPLIGFGIAVGWLFAEHGRGAATFVVGAALGGFVGGGKLVVLAGAAESAPFGTWELAALVVYSDLASALFILANVQLLYRLPLLGRKLAATREAGYRLLAGNDWMRRLAFLTLVLFVALPLQGTGALLGVVIGRIMGLSRKAIVAGAAAGSAAGAMGLAALGDLGRDQVGWLLAHPEIGVATAAATIGLTLLVGRRVLGTGLRARVESR